MVNLIRFFWILPGGQALAQTEILRNGINILRKVDFDDESLN